MQTVQIQLDDCICVIREDHKVFTRHQLEVLAAEFKAAGRHIVYCCPQMIMVDDLPLTTSSEQQ